MCEEEARSKYLHGQPKNLTNEQKFRLVLKLLRAEFPADLPIKVRRRDNADMMGGGKDAPWGYCMLSNSHKPKAQQYYTIYLNKAAPAPVQIDSLMHEWAHCLTWHLVENHTDHGDSFHRAYGKIYRFMIED